MRIEIVYRTRAKVGEAASGDAAFVREGPLHTLFAVIDALGHGPVAQAVAQKAIAALDTVPLDRGVLVPLEAMHEALRGTRGAAVTLGLHTHGEGTAELCGVGNVSVRGSKRSIPFVPTPGVVGSRISRPRSSTIEFYRGEGVLLLSDGIPRRATIGSLATMDANAFCDHLMAQAHEHDDATVLLVNAPA